MKRLLLLAPAAALVLAPAASGGKDPHRAQVVAREFSFALSRATISSGDAVIELANFGSDPHNLQIKRVKDGTIVAGTGDVSPGNLGELEVKLKPGKYELYCSIANHEALGMSAILKVKQKRASAE